MIGKPLKGKILFLIPGKIQSLGFRGHPLQGIVAEAEALAVSFAQAFFGAENLPVLQSCAVDAVDAGAFYLFRNSMELSSVMSVM